MSARKQFQAAFPKVLIQRTSVNFGDAATGSGTFASVDVAFPGAALGNVVLVAIALDTVDTVVAGAVTATDVVTLTVLNNTAGAVNLAAAEATIVVLGVKAE